jgi:hypothetical protein
MTVMLLSMDLFGIANLENVRADESQQERKDPSDAGQQAPIRLLQPGFSGAVQDALRLGDGVGAGVGATVGTLVDVAEPQQESIVPSEAGQQSPGRL